MLTSDWSDSDIAAYLDFCAACAIADITVPVTVWANESDNRTTAHNPSGDASGLFQLMPMTARGLGWDITKDPHLDAYRALPVCGQLTWAGKFYGNHAGQVSTVARFYLCTFLPALLSHGDSPPFVLCAPHGPYAWAYIANRGFDRTGKGWITVQDMVDAANRAIGPRTLELLQRIRTFNADRETIPALPETTPEPPEAA